MNPYLYLLHLWGGPLPQLIAVRPNKTGVAVRVAAANFTWHPSPPPAANDPCPP